MANSTITIDKTGRTTITTGPLKTCYGKGHAAAAQIALLHDAIRREQAVTEALRTERDAASPAPTSVELSTSTPAMRKLAGLAREDHELAKKLLTEFDAYRLFAQRMQAIVRSVVGNCRHIDDTMPRNEPGPMCGPTWRKVAHICGLGCAAARQLCRDYGIDPGYDCARQAAKAKESAGK